MNRNSPRGPPPCDLDPKYDLRNTPNVNSPRPSYPPGPDFTPEQVNRYLRDLFASVFGISPDHLLIEDLAARFEGDGRALYSTFRSELEQMFGSEFGWDVDMILTCNKYWLTRKVDFCLRLTSIGVFHDVTEVWTGDHTNVVISELSAFGVILFWLRYHISANYLIRASEFFYRF